jgi:hypothetical protein
MVHIMLIKPMWNDFTKTLNACRPRDDRQHGYTWKHTCLYHEQLTDDDP